MSKQAKMSIIIGIIVAALLIVIYLTTGKNNKNPDVQNEGEGAMELTTEQKNTSSEDKEIVSNENVSEKTTELKVDTDEGVKYGGRTGLTKEDNEASQIKSPTESEVKGLIESYMTLTSELAIGKAKDPNHMKDLATRNFISNYYPDGVKNSDSGDYTAFERKSLNIKVDKSKLGQRGIPVNVEYKYYYTRKNGSIFIPPMNAATFVLRAEDGKYKIDAVNI